MKRAWRENPLGTILAGSMLLMALSAHAISRTYAKNSRLYRQDLRLRMGV